MALLGDVEKVERDLRAMPGSSLNADAMARLADIQVAVTAFIEERTGRVFGEAGLEETVVVQAPTRSTLQGVYGASLLLILPKAVRAITRVAVAPEWSGTGWTGGVEVEASEYRPAMFTRAGDALALESVGGEVWYGRYIVTGIFEDAGEGTTVPADIEFVANLLMADMFKYQQTSTAAQAGPDGQTLPLKNSVKHPIVEAILCRYETSVENIVV